MAEIEHNRGYKNSGALPNDLRRRLSILAGTLELVDRELDAVVRAIDRRTSENSVDRDKLNSINIKNLFLTPQFQFLDEPERFVHYSTGTDDDTAELTRFSVMTVGDLRALIPPDFGRRATDELGNYQTT